MPSAGIAAPGCELQKAQGITDTGADLTSAEPIAKEMVQQGAKDRTQTTTQPPSGGWVDHQVREIRTFAVILSGSIRGRFR